MNDRNRGDGFIHAVYCDWHGTLRVARYTAQRKAPARYRGSHNSDCSRRSGLAQQRQDRLGGVVRDRQGLRAGLLEDLGTGQLARLFRKVRIADDTLSGGQVL